MQEFARGLKLKVSDRKQFKSYVQDNSHDPGMQMENWGNNSVPKEIYIDNYTDENPSYYRTYDKHVNDEVSWNYWNEPLLVDMINEGILINTDNYDVDFVEEQE